MSEFKPLFYSMANTKQKLVDLYISQYSVRDIRFYVNDIIKMYRPNKNSKCKNISILELLSFTELYGLPTGYELSNQLLRYKELLKNNIKV